jgi:hypothetical protein
MMSFTRCFDAPFKNETKKGGPLKAPPFMLNGSQPESKKNTPGKHGRRAWRDLAL